MNKIYALVNNLQNRTTALNHVQKRLSTTLKRIFVVGYGEHKLNFDCSDWNDRAADPFENCPGLSPLRLGEITIYAF